MMKLSDLKGVGKKFIESLNQNHIFTTLDLLLHLPRSYQDRTDLNKIDNLIHGDFAQVTGIIQATKINYHSKRKILSCEIQDETGSLVFKLFNFYPNQIHTLSAGRKILLYGQVRISSYLAEMIHPEWKIIPNGELTLAKHLTPLYSTLKGIGSKRIQSYIQQILKPENLTAVQDLMPEKYKQKHNLVPLGEAINFLHSPEQGVELVKLQQGQYKQQKTIIFEELLAHCLSAQKVKAQYQKQKFYPINKITTSLNKFLDNLDFSLTKSQIKVISEIHQDLFNSKYMSRLVQGDVGSGKTIVAALTILPVLKNGYQAIIMAPTEILADQHFAKFKQWFGPLGYDITLLLGKQSAKDRKKKLSEIKSGKT
ncbi:MAG: ATP-dependent DNA helicase RecG, partial [Francisellaceae bacterium]